MVVFKQQAKLITLLLFFYHIFSIFFQDGFIMIIFIGCTDFKLILSPFAFQKEQFRYGLSITQLHLNMLIFYQWENPSTFLIFFIFINDFYF